MRLFTATRIKWGSSSRVSTCRNRTATARRSFSNLPLSRPALRYLNPNNQSLFSPPTTSSVGQTVCTASTDIVPRVSTHPAFSSLQVRYTPRNTFNPSHRVRKRRHGFLARIKTRKGRATLKRRKLKGRWHISHR